MTAVHYLSACELATQIRNKTLSVSEVLDTFLQRIDAINPSLNAIVTRCDEMAWKVAKDYDTNFRPAGKPLYGLPIAIKDLALTKGIRTTFGSPIFGDFVPDENELFVQRLIDAGAIIIGKTNTPEFGAGSQTFNKVFGATSNPYDTTKTCGGSSGGAAVAVATGMLPFADGSDLGGSLRNPAAFCNIVGFRPSPGRVPNWPKQLSSDQLSVCGPMGRNVGDVALLHSAMAGPDPRVPISMQEPGDRFRESLSGSPRDIKIAYSNDIGLFEIDSEIIFPFEDALGVFESCGATLVNDAPQLDSAREIFSTLRGWLFAARLGPLLEKNRPQMKDTVVWNIEQGLALSVSDLTRAETLRSALIAQIAQFFERYDFLICPSTQVLPFSIDTEWIDEINGVTMPTYLDWMGVCWAITVTGCPSISVPIGFSSSGLPVGMQIVGPHGRDFDVLRLAHDFEQLTRHAEVHPNLPR